MARYKVIDTSPRFLAVDLERQQPKGSASHLCFFIDVIFIFLCSESKIGLRFTVEWLIRCSRRSPRFLLRAPHPGRGTNLITETALTERLTL